MTSRKSKTELALHMDLTRQKHEAIVELVHALERVGAGASHFDSPRTVEGGTFNTLHGVVTTKGGPCVCRWCKARRLVDRVRRDHAIPDDV